MLTQESGSSRRVGRMRRNGEDRVVPIGQRGLVRPVVVVQALVIADHRFSDAAVVAGLLALEEVRYLGVICCRRKCIVRICRTYI